MKQNTQEFTNKIIENINIIADFGELLVEGKQLGGYEDELPHSKESIIWAIMSVLSMDTEVLALIMQKDNTEVQKYKEQILSTSLYLDDYIPNKKNYEQKVSIIEQSKKLMKRRNNK